MGIPHLTAQIRPYAQPFSWSSNITDENKCSTHRSSLIIDGPSFAYYIYHRVALSKPSSSSALTTLPAYSELAEAAIAWLEEIETFGVFV